jgi:hypothetical protein
MESGRVVGLSVLTDPRFIVRTTTFFTEEVENSLQARGLADQKVTEGIYLSAGIHGDEPGST